MDILLPLDKLAFLKKHCQANKVLHQSYFYVQQFDETFLKTDQYRIALFFSLKEEG